MLHALMLAGASEGGGSGGGGTNLVIAANTSNYDVFASAGSPTAAVQVTVTINSGVTVSDSASRLGYAITTNAGLRGWPAGSTVKIVNNGAIEGHGGNGNSGSGGAAVQLGCDTTIDNTNGYIRGGGAGGAQAPAGTHFGLTEGGGGGGGGQGSPGGSGGSGGLGGGSGADGSAGHDGTSSAAGTGGAGASNGGSVFGGSGGSGGAWGAVGGASSPSSSSSGIAATGTPGNAVALNGHAVTWAGGFNGTQVKGSVA